MAIAVLVLGVVLRNVGLQTVAVSKATDHYQALLCASHVLESELADGYAGSKLTGKSAQGFAYTVDSSVVTADPRVEQIEVVVNTPRGDMASLSAYRLRIRRGNAPSGSGGGQP